MPEPILWAHKAEATRSIPCKRWNPATQQMEQAYDDDTGLPLREKVPQRGHDGKPADYDKPGLANMQRWIHVLRHDGHVVRAPVTMAAADQEGVDFFGKYVKAKAQYFGWIPVGHCPAALLIAGVLFSKQIVDDDVRAAPPCTHGTYGENRPCPHYLAEAAARKDRKARLQRKVDKAFASEADKMLKAQQQQTTDIVSGVGNALAEAIRAIAPQRPPEPEPELPPAAPASVAPTTEDEPKGGRRR